MKRLRQLFKYINNQYLFDTTKRERRQTLSVFILAILILAGNKIYTSANQYLNPDPESDFASMLYAYDSTNTALTNDDTLNRLDRYIVERYSQLTLFKFNPNTAKEDELTQLGLTQKQINTLLNYRSKGGTFTCKDDFRKLYGIRYRQFQILRPYIDLPEKETNNYMGTASTSSNKNNKAQNQKPTPNDDSTKTELFKFDPNFISEEDMYRLGFYTKQIESFIKMRNEGKKYYVKQDFAALYFVDDKKFKQLEPYINIDLVKLLGHEAYNLNTITADELASKIDIPEKDAQKIVEMRTALGGFYSVYQLSDCGIAYNLAQKYAEYLFVAPSFKITKININDIPENDLKAHPLFNAKQAEVVLKYRNEKGRLMHIEDLRSLNRFDKNELKKIERYFSFK